MMHALRTVLIGGESRTTCTIHQTRNDSFAVKEYGKGHQWLQTVLAPARSTVEYLPYRFAVVRGYVTAGAGIVVIGDLLSFESFESGSNCSPGPTARSPARGGTQSRWQR